MLRCAIQLRRGAVTQKMFLVSKTIGLGGSALGQSAPYIVTATIMVHTSHNDPFIANLSTQSSQQARTRISTTMPSGFMTRRSDSRTEHFEGNDQAGTFSLTPACTFTLTGLGGFCLTLQLEYCAQIHPTWTCCSL